MKSLTILGIIASVGLLFTPAAFAGDPKGPPGGLGVNVVNEPTVHVGSTADVNVVNTPLPVTGTLTGTISGEVEVTNDTNNPVPVMDVTKDACVRQIVHEYVSDTIDESTIGSTVTIYPDIPKDFVLVIESISAEMILEDPLAPIFFKVSGGSAFRMNVPLIPYQGKLHPPDRLARNPLG
jgi:hypothetical protein